MEEKKNLIVATCNRKISRDLLWTMSGTAGIVIYERVEAPDYKSKITFSAEEDESMDLLELYIRNNFLLCGNVTFEDK